MKANFFVIGAMRCGMQSMYHYLSQHPSIYMCPTEAQGYFANDNSFSMGIPNMRKYEARFTPNHPESLLGEVCSEYLFNPQYLSRLQLYNPKLQLVAILRNPAERAYSHWQDNVNKGHENRPFMKAIEDELSQINSDSNLNEVASNYIRRGMYGAQIRSLLQYFDPHQILILKNEDLRDDAQVALYQVFQFLDLPYYEVDHTPQNLGDYDVSMNVKDYNALIRVFEKDIYILEEQLGWNCNEWLRSLNESRPMLSYIES